MFSSNVICGTLLWLPLWQDFYCDWMSQVRWNIAVSPDTDQSLRMFLASRGGGRKGDLSRFIEEAVRAYILELTADEVKTANANVSEGDLSAMVDEAVQWARSH